MMFVISRNKEEKDLNGTFHDLQCLLEFHTKNKDHKNYQNEYEISTLNSHHPNQQQLQSSHPGLQLGSRNHKGPQKIGLHLYQ